MEEIAPEIVSLGINLDIKVNYNIIFSIIIVSVQCFKELCPEIPLWKRLHTAVVLQ